MIGFDTLRRVVGLITDKLERARVEVPPREPARSKWAAAPEAMRRVHVHEAAFRRIVQAAAHDVQPDPDDRIEVDPVIVQLQTEVRGLQTELNRRSTALGRIEEEHREINDTIDRWVVELRARADRLRIQAPTALRATDTTFTRVRTLLRDYTVALDACEPRTERERLDVERPAITHRFALGGEGDPIRLYITPGMYRDGRLGELFITADKQGSFVSGLFDTIATLISIALQHGVPLEAITRKMRHTRFPPSDIIEGLPEVPSATSVLDYVAQYLEARFPGGTATAELAKARDLASGERFDRRPETTGPVAPSDGETP